MLNSSFSSQHFVMHNCSNSSVVFVCHVFVLLLQAVMTSKTGTVNNVIQVKTTDFEVFDALRLDSQESADMSGTDSNITP